VGVKIYSPELVAANRSHSETSPLIAGQKRTTVTWLGHPAFDITTEDPEHRGVQIYREVWIGNRAYHCNVWGRPTASELATLFDSFSPAK